MSRWRAWSHWSQWRRWNHGLGGSALALCALLGATNLAAAPTETTAIHTAPTDSASAEATAPATPTRTPTRNAVEANSANEAELDSIKGLGPSSTARILETRASGPFRDWADFMRRVKGIKAPTAHKLSAQGLTVNGLPYPAPVPSPSAACATAGSNAPCECPSPACPH